MIVRIRTLPGLSLAIVLIPVFGVVLLFAMGMNPFSQSEYAYCVTAEMKSAFTGEWLKNDGRVSAKIALVSDCESRDATRDGGDGAKRGLVRWVVCPKGPDCDESGNF